MKNLLTCPFCGKKPKIEYTPQAVLIGAWQVDKNRWEYLCDPKGWRFCHWCSEQYMFQFSGSGFETKEEAERSWQYTVSDFVHNPIYSFNTRVESNAEALTVFSPRIGDTVRSGDSVTLTRRSMTITGIVYLLQRDASGEVSLILRDTDTVKHIIHTPWISHGKYVFSYKVNKESGEHTS